MTSSMSKVVQFADKDSVINAVRFNGECDAEFAEILRIFGVEKFALNMQFFDDPILVIVRQINPLDVQIAKVGDYVMKNSAGTVWTETAEQIKTQYKRMDEK